MKIKKLEKISFFIWNTIFIIFSVILITILYCMFFSYERIIYNFNSIILFLGIVIYIFGMAFFYKKIIPKLLNIKHIEYYFFALFLFNAIIIGLFMRVGPTWDMGSCYNVAKAYVEQGTYAETYYLSVFPHNSMMVIIDVCLIKFFTILGIKDYIIPFVIVVSMLITGSIIIAFKCVQEMFNKEKALLFLVLSLLTTPFYFYAVEYYTDTFSMIFSVLFLFLWLKIMKKEKSTILEIIFGFLLFLGMKIKVTCSFVFIAIIIYELLNGKYKELLSKIKIILLVCSVCIVLFNIIVMPKMVKKELSEQNEIPTEHWIMMGLHGKGDFDYEEYAYTQSFPSLKERKEKDREIIKKRIFYSSWKEKINWYKRKISFTWNDGSYYLSEVLRRDKLHENRVHSLVMAGGKNNKYYKYFPQIMHEGMLIYILINSISIIYNKKYKKYDTICILTTLGLMVFLLFWETRPRYLINLLPIIMIAQINGIECVSFIFKKKKKMLKA